MLPSRGERARAPNNLTAAALLPTKLTAGTYKIDRHDNSHTKSQFRFPQDGKPLTQDQTVLLLRQLFLVACEPGTLGGMTVGPSPLDPLFMVVHPIFEKALHVLMLSPTYADKYDFTWEASDCGDGVSGGAIDDTLPFTGALVGIMLSVVVVVVVLGGGNA